MLRITTFALTAMLLAACQGSIDDGSEIQLSASIGHGTAGESAALEFLNHPEVGYDLLVGEVGLTESAASGIVAGRPFAALADADTLLEAGEVVRLLEWLQRNGWITAGHLAIGSWHGVVFSQGQAELTLELVNRGTTTFLAERLGLGAGVAGGIVAGRPWSGLDAVASLPGVDGSSLTILRDAATLWVD